VDDTAGVAGWKATNLIKLNNCEDSKVWFSEFDRDSMKAITITIDEVDVKSKVATGPCGSLTPQFGFLK